MSAPSFVSKKIDKVATPAKRLDAETNQSVGLVETKYFHFAFPPDEISLESGKKLGPLTVAYDTYGKLNDQRSNAILILHALSGDAHAAGFHKGDEKPGWWDDMGTLIDITQYINQSYRESVDSGRVYDLAVRAVGTYDGTVNGTAFINGYPLLTFTGTGTDFSTPQSLLGKSTHIALVSAGKNELLRVLGNVKANRFIQVSASGTLSKAVSQQITIYVEILTQFDTTP